MPKLDYSRDDLLAICERAFVPETRWFNRDSASAQRQLGECYALLKAGCNFVVQRGDDGCSTDDHTVWVEVACKGFAHMDYDGPLDRETYYLPTAARLDDRDGRDWY